MQPQTRFSALLEIVALFVVAVGVQATVYPISWRFSSLPAALAAIVLATLFLRARSESWAELGLRLPNTWKSGLLSLGQTLLAFIIILPFRC
jgi:hypothetical protein